MQERRRTCADGVEIFLPRCPRDRAGSRMQPVACRSAPQYPSVAGRVLRRCSISVGRYGTSAQHTTDHRRVRSEEHTSELQSRQYLVCRLLLGKKKKQIANTRPARKLLTDMLLAHPARRSESDA